MAKITYSKTSPYSATPQSNFFLGRYVHRAISSDAGDKLITLEARHQYRPDMLSQELYGTPQYYWVFMCRNMNVIRDLVWDFTAGTKIVAPSLAHIRSIVG